MSSVKVFSGAPWEQTVGYCRAIKVDNIIEIAGTTAIDESGNVVGLNDVAKQTEYIIQKDEKALLELGATLQHVVRTRMYVTNIDEWEAVGSVHGKYFSNIQPTTTMVEVTRLIDPALLIEIEFTANLNA
jgi:enamine deaminase RidA (YjgF/YER057c/UK114 family)